MYTEADSPSSTRHLDTGHHFLLHDYHLGKLILMYHFLILALTNIGQQDSDKY